MEAPLDVAHLIMPVVHRRIDVVARPPVRLCFLEIISWPFRPNYGFQNTHARSHIVWPLPSRIVWPELAPYGLKAVITQAKLHVILLLLLQSLEPDGKTRPSWGHSQHSKYSSYPNHPHPSDLSVLPPQAWVGGNACCSKSEITRHEGPMVGCVWPPQADPVPTEALGPPRHAS